MIPAGFLSTFILAALTLGGAAFVLVASGAGLGKLSAVQVAQVSSIATALTVGLPFALLGVSYARILIAMNRASAVLTISTIKIVLNLAGNLLLIHPFGLVGLAAATVIAEAASALMFTWYARRVMDRIFGTRPRRAHYG